MKKYIFILMIISSPFACAEELKLSCNIEIVKEFYLAPSERTHFTEVLEITDYGKFKSIIPASDNIGSVSTKENPKTIYIRDFSDSNKWNISNQAKGLEEGVVITTSINIDRNTGKIWYWATYEKSGIVKIKDTGKGDCEKINITKKKF